MAALLDAAGPNFHVSRGLPGPIRRAGSHALASYDRLQLPPGDLAPGKEACAGWPRKEEQS
eukprot:763450-Hanusia_phi.AAC.1